MDYSAIQRRAQASIKTTGRELTFIRLQGSPADTDKPWRGATSPRAPSDKEVKAYGVSVHPASPVHMGSIFKTPNFSQEAEVVFLVALQNLNQAVNLRDFDEVLDGGTRWRIVEVQPLQPGPTVLLYFVSVRR